MNIEALKEKYLNKEFAIVTDPDATFVSKKSGIITDIDELYMTVRMPQMDTTVKYPLIPEVTFLPRTTPPLAIASRDGICNTQNQTTRKRNKKSINS